MTAVADVIVYLIARAGGVPFTLGLPGIDSIGGVTWYFVAAAAGVAALAGVAYAAVLRRRLTPHRGALVFGWTVALVAVASCAPLLALGLAAETAVVLAILHLVAGTVVFATLRPTFRAR